MNGRFLLLVTGLCGIFLTGCSVYDPKLLPNTDNAECPPGTPPCRPPLSTTNMTDAVSRSFVITDVLLDQTAGSVWRDIGIDLDGLETTADGVPAECNAVSQSPDGNDGRDNRFGEQLWPVIRARLPSLQCEINWAHSRGHGALVVTFEGFNGLPDDARVTASIVPAVDGTSASNPDCSMILNEELVDGLDNPLPDPLLDGDDWFCLNPDGLSGQIPSGAPLVVDSDAYVADNVLVMKIPETADFTLYSTRSSVAIQLGDGTLVMPMDPDFQTATEGYVGGRFSINNLMNVGPAIGVCNQADIEMYYFDYADIRATAPDVFDPLMPDANCDAISIGVRFDAVKANVAGTAQTAVEPFQACDMVGPAGTWVVPQPVQDCCDALNPSDQAGCHAYWDAM